MVSLTSGLDGTFERDRYLDGVCITSGSGRKRKGVIESKNGGRFGAGAGGIGGSECDRLFADEEKKSAGRGEAGVDKFASASVTELARISHPGP
jgi:hypothetical protein